jgi:Eukaryotic mitochondrial regulator protein
MPPRIHPPNPVTLSRPSPQTHCTSCLLRAFSTSPQYKRTTLLRRRLFAWLNGPGAGLREPVPNSTNYLSAYDMRTGRRLTGPKGARRRGGPEAQTADSQALEDAAVDNSRQASADDRALRPFPMNPHFVSQSVLSEPLRQEVWRRVQVEKKPARQVSVELGIEMRRVGAVVRLVEVERRMRAEVRLHSIPDMLRDQLATGTAS